MISLLLVVGSFATLQIVSPHHPPSLVGRTPCCLDRLSPASCIRLRQTNPNKFVQRCASDADFAMIQCCATCFDRRLPNSTALYSETVQRQLQSTISAPCWDRRGPQWCSKLVQKEGFWDSPRFNQMGCGTFPFAFRECRHSCGYCSSGTIISRIRYEHSLATDPKLCDVKTYFARNEDELRVSNVKRAGNFDPLALLKISKEKRPDDYFVVTEHNYDVSSSREDSRERREEHDFNSA